MEDFAKVAFPLERRWTGHSIPSIEGTIFNRCQGCVCGLDESEGTLCAQCVRERQQANIGPIVAVTNWEDECVYDGEKSSRVFSQSQIKEFEAQAKEQGEEEMYWNKATAEATLQKLSECVDKGLISKECIAEKLGFWYKYKIDESIWQQEMEIDWDASFEQVERYKDFKNRDDEPIMAQCLGGYSDECADKEPLTLQPEDFVSKTLEETIKTPRISVRNWYSPVHPISKPVGHIFFDDYKKQAEKELGESSKMMVEPEDFVSKIPIVKNWASYDFKMSIIEIKEQYEEQVKTDEEPSCCLFARAMGGRCNEHKEG